MLIDKKIKVVEKSSRQYEYQGKSGISYKVRALVDDTDIFEFKFNKDSQAVFESIPDKGAIDVTLQITAPKEVLRCDIVAVKKAS